MSVDRVWCWYLATTAALALVVGIGSTALSGGTLRFAALQATLGVALLVLRRLMAGSSPQAQRVGRAVYTVVAIPTVFLALGWVLPGVHPEPYEWVWMRCDRALFGCDPTVALGPLLHPWLVELLQWAYASFYLLPVVAVLACGVVGSGAGFDRALVTVTFGFLGSYLGYFLWPTLPPYLFLPHGEPLRGVLFAEQLNAGLAAAELHRWNCFPSGHTMMSLVSLVLVWRVWPAFFALLPVVVLLVFSTVALRYHYVVDVLAGAVLVAPTMVGGRLLDRA